MRSTRRDVRRFTRPFKALYHHLRLRKRVDAVQLVALLWLPVEILLLITDHLDLSDAASLSLVCRLLAAKLGAHIWTAVNTKSSDSSTSQKHLFLARLATDLSDSWFCRACIRLHLTQHTRPCITYSNELRSSSCYFEYYQLIGCCYEAGHQDISRYRLQWPHVHLAMKRQRLGGAHGIALQDLAITEVQTYSGTESKHSPLTTLLSVEPLIVADELYLRVQNWVLFSNGSDALDPDRLTFMYFCFHDPSRFPMIQRMIGEYVIFRDAGVSHAGMHQFCCEVCAASFEVQLRAVDDYDDDNGCYGRKMAWIVTKWLNVGDGDALEQSKWRRHLTPLDLSADEHEQGTIEARLNQSVVEDQSGLSLKQELTMRNERILQTGEFYMYRACAAYVSGFTNWVKTS